MPTSSNPEFESDATVCHICGRESICEGLGVIRYDVPVEDPRFGKLFRCPNNPLEMDTQRQDRLRRLSNLDAYADKSFANFIIDMPTLKPTEQQSLQMALNMAYRYAQNPDGWLLLEGTYGCGKTHLAAAVGHERLRQGTPVLFVTVPDLLDHLRATYGPNSEVGYDETFDRIRNAPILILDDLGSESPSHWAREKLFQLLNHRSSRRIPTVLTTNINLDTLDERIRSRLLDNNLIRRVAITAPDYRTASRNQFEQMSDLALYGEMRFDTFNVKAKVVQDESRNLQKVLKDAQDYAQNPQGWRIYTGPAHTGKTHLAASIANYWVAQGGEVMFVTAPDLLDYLRVTFSPDAPVSFDQRFRLVRNAPFLVLDGLTKEGSSWAKEKLFQILDYRYITRRPTVITTTLLVEEIEERIRHRLMDERLCTIFALKGPSYAERQKRKS